MSWVPKVGEEVRFCTPEEFREMGYEWSEFYGGWTHSRYETLYIRRWGSGPHTVERIIDDKMLRLSSRNADVFFHEVRPLSPPSLLSLLLGD